jgi:predicted phage terminase large subunit-like protein
MKWNDYGAWEWSDRAGDDNLSMTFISAHATDNPIMLRNNPKYLIALRSLPLIDRERLLYGNWNIAPAPGLFFKANWFGPPIMPGSIPSDVKYIRYWDRASVEASKASQSHSWTVGVKMGHSKTTRLYYISDVVRGQWSPAEVQNRIKLTAERDLVSTTIVLEEDPGQAGKFEISSYLSHLSGYSVRANRVRQSKMDRAKPLSAAVENGLVRIVDAPWYSAFVAELERFDGSEKQANDQVDATSGAFHMLSTKSIQAW